MSIPCDDNLNSVSSFIFFSTKILFWQNYQSIHDKLQNGIVYKNNNITCNDAM